MQYSIIITTINSKDEAEKLASKILAEKLGACVQVQEIKSFYNWEGKGYIEKEWKLSIKTKSELFDIVQLFIKNNHPYKLPEIIQIPIVNGSDEYLDWIDKNVI